MKTVFHVEFNLSSYIHYDPIRRAEKIFMIKSEEGEKKKFIALSTVDVEEVIVPVTMVTQSWILVQIY